MRRIAAAAVAGLFVIAGCGLPVDSAARAFSAGQAAQPVAGGPNQVSVYFLRHGLLHAVLAPSSAPGAIAALVFLAAGPTPKEQNMGISTAIENPAAITLPSAANNGVITVEVNDYLAEIPSGRLLYEAYGQIVYTLTSPGLGITAVQFDVGTDPWSFVLEPDNSAAPSGEVTRADYCKIAEGGCAGLARSAASSAASG